MKPGSSQNIIVVYDLGNQFCQISYYVQGTENIETVASVAGTENYSIPTVLCKRSGVNQWFYGKEALRYAGEQDGVLVENLLDQYAGHSGHVKVGSRCGLTVRPLIRCLCWRCF